jgi:bifunctional non-homologous end joining protein LigD
MPTTRKGSLTRYRSKRDFKATPEPKGKLGATTDARRFMIHKHDASRLHYDLRLEIGGVYASWAVPKGPTMDPDEKRLAAMTEDHPLEYGEFEGVIPEGHYGAGPSMIWDSGVFTVEGDDSPESQLANGELKLVLLGRKLQGGFVLVRMKGKGAKAKDWLLIKRHDAYAKSDWDINAPRISKSVTSGRTIDEIRAGQ